MTARGWDPATASAVSGHGQPHRPAGPGQGRERRRPAARRVGDRSEHLGHTRRGDRRRGAGRGRRGVRPAGAPLRARSRARPRATRAARRHARARYRHRSPRSTTPTTWSACCHRFDMQRGLSDRVPRRVRLSGRRLMERDPLSSIAPPAGSRPRYLAEVVVARRSATIAIACRCACSAFDGVGSQDSPVWARVARPFAGDDRGAFLLPDVGDEVLVVFVQGDPRYPLVVGGLWNGAASRRAGVDRRRRQRTKRIRSKNGIQITLEDHQGQETLTLKTPGGQKRHAQGRAGRNHARGCERQLGAAGAAAASPCRRPARSKSRPPRSTSAPRMVKRRCRAGEVLRHRQMRNAADQRCGVQELYARRRQHLVTR